MAVSNTSARYGSVAMVFHWLVALAIVTAIPLGLLANWAGIETSEALARKAYLFSLHKTLGLWIFVIAVARILWACTQMRPWLLHPERRAETWLAGLVHWLLYVSLVIVPLSGWVVHGSTEGFAPLYGPFDRLLPDLPTSDTAAGVAAALHIIFERVLVVAILLHVAGAVKHHVIDRDATLRRMLPGRGEIEGGPAHPRAKPPILAAFAVYAAAIGIGWGLGVFEHGEDTTAEPELAEVESGWLVEDGTLALSVFQLGNTTAGQFDDWTAAIDFAPEPRDGVYGSVDVTIAISSLTLGSITGTALGVDFFDAVAFPSATYVGPIVQDGEGYRVDGVLTIKDAGVPVSLPFDLQIDGDRAVVQGETEVNRMNFGVGPTFNDPAQVGFGVTITVNLTARNTTP